MGPLGITDELIHSMVNQDCGEQAILMIITGDIVIQLSFVKLVIQVVYFEWVILVHYGEQPIIN